MALEPIRMWHNLRKFFTFMLSHVSTQTTDKAKTATRVPWRARCENFSLKKTHFVVKVKFCLVFGGFGVVGTVHTDDEDLRMSVYRSGNRRGLAGSADDIDCGEADACPSE